MLNGFETQTLLSSESCRGLNIGTGRFSLCGTCHQAEQRLGYPICVKLCFDTPPILAKQN